MELRATVVNALAIVSFEIVYMPVMDTIALWCAALGTKFQLYKHGECRLFETPLPIQAVPGFFSSRLLLAYLQFFKIVAVLALILFEAFGDSKEVPLYTSIKGATIVSGFTTILGFSEGSARQAEILQNVCVRDAQVYETLQVDKFTFLCGQLAVGNEYMVRTGDNNRRGSPAGVCTKSEFEEFDNSRTLVEVTLCNGKVNGFSGIYLNFTDNIIEASAVTSEFDGYGGYVTNVHAVRLSRPPSSRNQSERAIRFYRNFRILRSVRLALRAELIDANIDPNTLELPSGSMSVQSPTSNTIYVLTSRAKFCLYAITAALLLYIVTLIALATVVFWNNIQVTSVMNLTNVLRVAVTPYHEGSSVFLVMDHERGGELHFVRRPTVKSNDTAQIHPAVISPNQF